MSVLLGHSSNLFHVFQFFLDPQDPTPGGDHIHLKALDQSGILTVITVWCDSLLVAHGHLNTLGSGFVPKVLRAQDAHRMVQVKPSHRLLPRSSLPRDPRTYLTDRVHTRHPRALRDIVFLVVPSVDDTRHQVTGTTFASFVHGQHRAIARVCLTPDLVPGYVSVQKFKFKSLVKNYFPAKNI